MRYSIGSAVSGRTGRSCRSWERMNTVTWTSRIRLQAPTLIVIGNETTGLSAGWREACDHMLSIPMSGSASSLNAANAGTVVLYEAARQRR